ncbi:glycosyltransferase family 4 protein [Halosquirtibacter laminarini]|uniref:Glycosyltransferase family 4 protein n=1 Tax=Halosquirtibacter laminarini TaxID=3374600 RepID=A0AC61NDE0_9BACT|nr:glycosyltransferase family 4 protein [Prolixibacteraceae bacterium]
MKPKRIVIIGPAWPYRGGIATTNERFAKEFEAEGHQVKLVTFTLQYPSILFPGSSQYATCETPSLDIERSINSINPISWIKTGKSVATFNPDIVIIRYWIPFLSPAFGTIARIIKTKSNAKVLLLADNIIPHEKRFFDNILTKYTVKHIDGFLTMSSSVLKQLEQFDQTKPRKLSVHPLFDNYGEKVRREESIKKLGLNPQYRYILFFGFIRDYKGLDLLIEAFSYITDLDPNIRLLIAGEYYSKPDKYLSLIKSHNLQKKVELHTHFIGEDQVKYYFNAADIVAQPYRSATQSGVTQIAYHFEIPMLVTDVGGLSEIVPDKKVGYVVPTDPKDIANALSDFYLNNRFTSFVDNIKVEKKRYSWDKLTQACYDVCQEITSREV